MGHENCRTDQTHYCRHCLKHCQRPLRHTPLRERKRRPPCTVKKISGHKHTIPIDRGFCATGVIDAGNNLIVSGEKAGIAYGTTCEQPASAQPKQYRGVKSQIFGAGSQDARRAFIQGGSPVGLNK
jgi:hypothetical protein